MAPAKKCEACEQEFFPAGHVKSDFLCNLGYGDNSKLFPAGLGWHLMKYVHFYETARFSRLEPRANRRTLLFIVVIITCVRHELQSVRTVQIADEWARGTRLDVHDCEFVQTPDRSEQNITRVRAGEFPVPDTTREGRSESRRASRHRTFG